MIATCQVANLTTGRIRLVAPNLSSQPALGQFLLQFLAALPGVTGVQVRVASASIVINYDPAICSQDDILDILRGRRDAPPALPAQAASGHKTLAAIPFPYADCEIIHAIRGRARLSAAIIGQHEELAGVLARFLVQQAGISRVRLSPRSESLVVEYDARVWDARALVTLIRAYNPDETDIAEWQAGGNDLPDEGSAHVSQSKRQIALAGTALALSLFVGPAAIPVSYALLAVSGWPILRRAYQTLVIERRLTVDTLDATAIVLLAATGVVWQAAFLNILLASGEWIRTSTQERARRALSEVLDYMADQAWVQREGQIVSIPASEVASGEIIFVFPGERIPVDGIVVGGRALVDQHALTGESMPMEKTTDDQVFAATVVSEGELRVRATRVGKETQVAQIVQLVQNAPVFDTRAQDYAEKWANRLVPYSFLGAGILALMGNLPQAITLLVIDYAAGFKVSAPTAVMSTMTRAARRGILIRGGRHVEQLAQIDAIVFDKTGTLTAGSPDVTQIVSLHPDFGEDDLLALAAAAESYLTHPVAEAVVKAAKGRGLTIPQRDDYDYWIGQGVVARVGDRAVAVGSRRFLKGRGIDLDPRAEIILAQIEALAASPFFIAVDGVPVGILALADPIRPETPDVIETLRNMGIAKMVMLTGDREPVARAVSHRVGLDDFVAEVFPSDKLATVQALQRQGYLVAVVGDGINDSPALAQADVGIAVNGGTALAQEAADVVILQGDLRKLVEAIAIAREGMDVIRQNWNIIRVPNTIGLGLAFTGLIGPLGASLISDGAALTAGANSLRPLMKDKPQTHSDQRLPQLPAAKMLAGGSSAS